MNHSGQTISLIGMPGSGKSTVGVLLAKRVELAFVDTDLLIQEQENATLAQIISARGHEVLREIEQQVLLDMPLRPSIVSTGGSVVYSEAIMERLTVASTVVYLRAKLETVEYRISLEPDRGIASPGDQTIEDVFNERVPLYERYSHVTIDVDDDPPKVLVTRIVSKLQL